MVLTFMRPAIQRPAPLKNKLSSSFDCTITAIIAAVRIHNEAEDFK